MKYVIQRAPCLAQQKNMRCHLHTSFHSYHLPTPPITLRMRLLVLIRFGNIQPQPVRIQVQLILPTSLLQDGRNIPRVFNSPQVHVAPALLDGVTNQLCRTCFTLGSHDGGLLFLTGFIDNEGGALGFLLGYLFGFNRGGEFGGEGEVLGKIC